MQALVDGADLFLCDYSMPAFSTERALAVLTERGSDVPLIVVTRAISEAAVVNLFRAGAKDYVSKGKLAMLPRVIGRVLRERAREGELQTAVRELAEANQRLRQMSANLVVAQERERALIARELHDSLGQVMTGIVIQLHAAQRTADPAQALQCRDNALAHAQQAINQIRTMSFHLRPAQLELLGFVAAVKATLDRQRDATGLPCRLRVRGRAPTTVLPCHSVALRILQEALTNIIRHAQARQVVVRLSFRAGETLVLTVGDDGQGFDVRAVLDKALSERNLGLYGMMERAEMIGGRLRLRSTPGHGSVLRVML